jgi:hypothetical protein
MSEPGTLFEAERAAPARRRPRTRTTMLAIVVAILLGIFLPPLVNVNRYRGNIANSISNAVGRPVSVGSLELRLLPQPGFDLHNLEVGDDAAISNEYLLRADEVTAYLRLSSLWRGRLEIARLRLTDPSLNVVRAEDGRWNLETLLSRTTQVPSAPTAQAHPERARRRFPYIEATGGRINFKFGLEKKAFTFTEADFALWLASENNWNMRLEAKPIRVDTRVTDTGTLKMEASFQRNSTLRYTPVKFSVSWRDGQLGQTTKLLTGLDHGWRGGTQFELNGTGTPADLAFTGDFRVDDFRRYDISTGGAMRLSAHCTGHYLAAEEKLTGLDCAGPVGKGAVQLSGTVQRLRHPFFDLSMSGHEISLESVMAFVRHSKRDLPEDLSARGTTDFAFQARRAVDPAAKTLWSGGGTTDGLILHSQALGPDLTVGTLTYIMALEPPEKPKRTMRAAKIAPAPAPPQEVEEFRLAVAPFEMALGGPTPTAGQATVTGSGFNVAIAGDSELSRALQVARALGIDIPRVDANGAAKLDIHVDGHWTGFEAPSVSGGVQLKNVHADVPGMIETVLVNSASINIDAKSLELQNVAGSFAKGPNFTGSVSAPRNCAQQCEMTFLVHADELSPERLNQLLNPKLRNRPWYNFFMPKPADQTNPLTTAAAEGQFTIDRWSMEGVVAAHLTGAMKIAEKRVHVSEMKADLLGGQHVGDWEADFSGDSPVFTGKGKLTHVSLAQLSTAMQDAWATGTADLNYQLKMTGMNPDELKSSASGIGDFAVKDGTLRRMGFDNKSALKVTKLDGTLELRDGNFAVSDAKLQSGAAVYTVQGTASWSRQLNFKLTDAAHAYALSGTLARPEVKQGPATEAALKP